MPDTTIIALVFTIISSVGSLAWFLHGQIASLKDYVNTQVEKVKQTFIEKLEYHERHDDKRISDLVDDIWELRLRYAAVEGLILKPAKSRTSPKVNTE